VHGCCAVALDIATRYALQRKQFSAPDSDDEVVIMDYLVLSDDCSR